MTSTCVIAAPVSVESVVFWSASVVAMGLVLVVLFWLAYRGD